MPSLPLTLLFMVLVGIAVSAWVVSSRTLLQSGVDDRYRGRVFGTYISTIELLALVGIGLAGLLGDTIGIVPVLSAAGSLYIGGGVLALLLRRRSTGAVNGPGMTGNLEEKATRK